MTAMMCIIIINNDIEKMLNNLPVGISIRIFYKNV